MSATEDRMALRPMEVAERLGISRTRVYELIAAGRLRSTKLDGVILIRPEWVTEMLEAGS